MHNHHKMIYPFRGDDAHLYDYCTGGKTGYTTVANSTLVSFAEKDGITLVCVVLDANSPSHYTDTRKLFDYCFDNFQALNIAKSDKEFSQDSGKNYGLFNNNEPYVKMDEDAYIIMPKVAQFSDATVKRDESTGEKGTVAQLTYTYADREVGHVSIVKTGAKVEDNYFTEQAAEPDNKAENVILIQPVWIVVILFIVVTTILLILLIKKMYDNFYYIRHRMEVKKLNKERFKEAKRKKRYRKKDRIFK